MRPYAGSARRCRPSSRRSRPSPWNGSAETDRAASDRCAALAGADDTAEELLLGGLPHLARGEVAVRAGIPIEVASSCGGCWGSPAPTPMTSRSPRRTSRRCDSALRLTARGTDEADPFPAVRAGIAYGEVVSRLGDVFGPTVDVAARLTSVARPGAVLVDGGCHPALSGRTADGDGDDDGDSAGDGNGGPRR